MTSSMNLLILSKIKLKGFCITHIITDLDVVVFFYFKLTLKRFEVSAVKACYFNFSDCSHKSRICRDPDLIMSLNWPQRENIPTVRWPWHLQSSLLDQLKQKKVDLTSFPFAHISALKNPPEQIRPNIWLMMSINCRTQRAYQIISHLMAFFLKL